MARRLAGALAVNTARHCAVLETPARGRRAAVALLLRSCDDQRPTT